jgi:hypothetical protein
MVYCCELGVKVLLDRHWQLPCSLITDICNFLLAPGYSSYLNISWNTTSSLSIDDCQLKQKHVLDTGLLLRHQVAYGISMAVAGARSVGGGSLGVWKYRNICIARRLVYAIRTVGIKPPASCKDTNDVDNNIELLRLLCQGPWPQCWSRAAEHAKMVNLSWQLSYCYRMMVDDARGHRDTEAALHDLRLLESIFVQAYINLDHLFKQGSGDQPYFHPWLFETLAYFDAGPLGAPRLETMDLCLYYLTWYPPRI